MEPFTYHRPKSLPQALARWAERPGTLFLAGGTDLMVRMREGTLRPPAVVSLRRLRELAPIEVGDTVRIGGLVTIAEILDHPDLCKTLPELAQAASTLGSPAVRSAATVGGNLCNASPCADTAPPLLVLDAVVVLVSKNGVRELPLEQLFVGPRQNALEPGELLLAVKLDAPSPSSRAAFLKKGRVRMDIAVASAAVRVDLEGGVCTTARVAAGSVGPTPLRLRETEKVLEGQEPTDEVLARARSTASEEVRPITDVRATADYRRHVTGVLVERALRSIREGRAS